MIVCVFLLAVGIAVLWHGGREVRVTRRLRDHGVRTTATVIGHERGHTIDQPLYGYSDQQGGQFTLTPTDSHDTFTPVGDQADVLYLPEDPGTSRLAATEGTPWKIAPFAFMLGALLCFGAVAFAVTLLSDPAPLAPPAPQAPAPQAPADSSSASTSMFTTAVCAGILLLALTLPVLRITSFALLHRTGIHTEGVVVRRTDASQSAAWLVDFEDHDGRRIQFASRRVPKRAGARIPVVYHRDRPQQAENASWAPVLRANVPAVLLLLFLLTMIPTYL
ncbi:hypothetical protein GCM10027271_58840 [Saccharopolyspora gloriosae]|nr:DUF3592 domain-containing protein [Saccharopolyspora gloriosae]